ncbi:PilN domain-containing protein [Bradyrhizobium sp.]|uniref:PilN domain-containing protein n=1 Tax=Bradyrhizobium sp. TaxID=376 RepID=UPI003C29558C
MRIAAILRRWIETLATMFVAWRERRREQHALTVAYENQHVVIRESLSGRDTAHPHFRAGQKVSADLLRAASNIFIVLELPAEKVVRRNITVPAQAQKFLSGVIRNQIERLSPWPPNNVVYGFNAEASGEDASVIEVRILMASRTDIDASRHHLTALGVQVDRIVANVSTVETVKGAGSVTLWSRLTDASHDRLEGTSRLIGLGIGAIAAVSMCLSLWAFVSTGLLRDESESIAARAKALQRQVQGGRTLSLAASMPLAERAWFLKETSISSVILIEALSRALPDSAHLTEIRVENATLRMTGLADDAPALLAPLEQSGHLTAVHFFAPTTRGPDGKSFRFSIEAHVEPRSKIAEE